MEEMYDSDLCPSVSPLVLLSTSFFLGKTTENCAHHSWVEEDLMQQNCRHWLFSSASLLFSFLFSHIQLPQPTPSYWTCLSQPLTSSYFISLFSSTHTVHYILSFLSFQGIVYSQNENVFNYYFPFFCGTEHFMQVFLTYKQTVHSDRSS